MFNRIGTKIKGLASAFTWIGIIASVFVGICFIQMDDDMFPIGLSIAIVGAIVSWLSSLCLYGFGELIEKTCMIEERLSNQLTRAGSIEDGVDELVELLRTGVISQAEYQEAINEK